MRTPHFKQPFRRANLAHKECEKLLVYCEKWFKNAEDYHLLKNSLVKASKVLNKIRSETLTKIDENGNAD